MTRLLAAVLVPGLLFAALCATDGGPDLGAYTWEQGVGYVPGEGSDVHGFGAGLAFFAKATGGLLTGRSGRSREHASAPLATLLAQRSARSAAIVGVAIAVIALHVLAGRGVSRRRRSRTGADFALPQTPAPPLPVPFGLPLPIAGFALFALVIRFVPAGSPLDFDRAGLLWAGLALAWADGVAAFGFAGLRHTSAVERSRPWARNLRLNGADARAAVAGVSAPARASQVKAALLGLVGGLVVVEGIFSVNGLGETLADLVVDRQGLDPLLLAGVLVVFSATVALLDALPLDPLVARWRT